MVLIPSSGLPAVLSASTYLSESRGLDAPITGDIPHDGQGYRLRFWLHMHLMIMRSTYICHHSTYTKPCVYGYFVVFHKDPSVLDPARVTRGVESARECTGQRAYFKHHTHLQIQTLGEALI